jgi:hypothetical protein
MLGTEDCQPSPKGPFPLPESYESERVGANPERAALVWMGKLRLPVPKHALTLKVSSMLRIAPPDGGVEMDGRVAALLPLLSVVVLVVLVLVLLLLLLLLLLSLLGPSAPLAAGFARVAGAAGTRV